MELIRNPMIADTATGYTSKNSIKNTIWKKYTLENTLRKIPLKNTIWKNTLWKNTLSKNTLWKPKSEQEKCSRSS